MNSRPEAEADAERAEFDRVNMTYWDQLTALHAEGDAYRVQQFLGGACILDPLVRSEIGDIAGKSLIHLQCHFGLDTLSLARLGATVTGVDYSPKGIETARRLSVESGVPGTFVESRIEEAPARIAQKFDMAYVTWGALNWLPDLTAWARTVAHVLKPGGFLYLAEFHPLAQAIDIDETGANGMLAIRYPMVGKAEARRWETATDYADEATPLQHNATWEWNHGLGEVIGALIGAGLRLAYYKEHPYLAWRSFPAMIERDEFFFGLPDNLPTIPLAYSLKAVKE
ncbi:MAG: class I SAM-dependent methyltransferase [Rhodospirillaceae bacterium]|nr:class I SAM-dependent methyltransferase [Rhodospirillaceae bacterium]